MTEPSGYGAFGEPGSVAPDTKILALVRLVQRGEKLTPSERSQHPLPYSRAACRGLLLGVNTSGAVAQVSDA